MASVNHESPLADITDTVANIDPEYMDLKDKYDTLFQQFKTIELEKQVYEKEMKKMNQDNMRLKQQRRESIKFEEITQPLLISSLQNTTSALDDADSRTEALIEENNDYRDLTDTLREELYTLREQNKQYRETVETMKNDEYNKELEYQHKLKELQKEIQDINKEEDDIYQKYEEKAGEYDALKAQYETELMEQMDTTQKDDDTEDKSTHLKFIRSTITQKRTPNPSTQNLFPYNIQNAKYQSNDKLQIVQYPSTDSLPGFMYNDPDQQMVNLMNEIKDRDTQIEELKRKCKQKDALMVQLRTRIETLIMKEKDKQNCLSWFNYD